MKPLKFGDRVRATSCNGTRMSTNGFFLRHADDFFIEGEPSFPVGIIQDDTGEIHSAYICNIKKIAEAEDG